MVRNPAAPWLRRGPWLTGPQSQEEIERERYELMRAAAAAEFHSNAKRQQRASISVSHLFSLFSTLWRR